MDFLHLTQSNFINFLVLLILILFFNVAIKSIASYFAKGQRVLPVIKSILNWLTFYGIILLFLYCFSHATWLFRVIYSQNGVDVTPFLLIVAFMIVTLAHRLVKLLIKYVLSSVYRYYHLDKGLGYTLNQIIYYTVMVAALAISLASVGLDFTALGAILGVLGIGIGFGMRNIAGNFVSGIIMLFERPVEVGDTIQINDKIGRIEQIRLRSTVVRTAKEGTLIVPNQYFIEQIIKNRSSAEMMAQVTVNIMYGMDPDLIFSLLKECVEEIKKESEGILNRPDQDIRFTDYQGNTMQFLIEIPVINFEIKEQVESNLRHSMAKLFIKNQIQLGGAVVPPIVKNDVNMDGLK